MAHLLWDKFGGTLLVRVITHTYMHTHKCTFSRYLSSPLSHSLLHNLSFCCSCFSLDLPSHKLIKLPALSPTMEQGTIVSWEKQEGDEVEEGDIIAQVETDKAVMDMETTEGGFIAKILVPAGTADIPLKTVCSS